MENAEILDGLLQKLQRSQRVSSHFCADIGKTRIADPTEFGSYCQA
jgi:hypothetical protein